MPHELLVGLQVKDDSLYAEYRRAMMPILQRFGGGFRYDFRIAETLRAENDAPINRVFTIHFVNRSAKDAFFADPDYQEAKRRFFEESVQATTILAEYERL